MHNQTDYICVSNRMRNSVLDCKTYPGADCGDDHQLLVARVSNLLKENTERRNTNEAWLRSS